MIRKHRSQGNFLQFLNFVDKYGFGEVAIMKYANIFEMQKSRRSKTFIQDLTNTLIQIRILEAISKIDHNETTDLI